MEITAQQLDKMNESFRSILNQEKLSSIVSLIPDEWLVNDSAPNADENRKVYEQFLLNRISQSHIFVKEAQYARQVLI